MEQPITRPLSELMHHAIATGDVSKLQSLLKQGVDADSRYYIDGEILETASRKSLTSLNSYRAQSQMDSTSIRESIIEEEEHQNSSGESTVKDDDDSVSWDGYTTNPPTKDTTSQHVGEGDQYIDRLIKECQQEVEEVSLNVTAIEVKNNDTDTENDDSPDVIEKNTTEDHISDNENGPTNDEDEINDESLQSPNVENVYENPESNNNNMESSNTMEQQFTVDQCTNEVDFDANTVDEHTKDVNSMNNQSTTNDQKFDSVADIAQEDDPLESTLMLQSIEDQIQSLEKNQQSHPVEDEYISLRDEKETSIKRKSISDTIDARLNDANESLIERAASVRVKEVINDDEEKPREKLIPRIKRRLSQKLKTKPKREPQEDLDDEEDDLKYQNINKPRNVDDEQLNENFEGVAFFEAVREGMDMIVQTLLETSNNYQLNMLDENGFTPIMQASWHGQRECLQILLDHGAQIDSKNATGCTAAHFAAGQGHTECLELLISHDSDVVDIKTKYGATPLLLAAKSGCIECVQLLLEAGADPNIQYRGNQTALLFAAGNGHYECIEELLKHNVFVDQPNSQLVTPLMRAVQQGHNTCVTLLIDSDADINRQDAIGRTAVHIAVEHNNPKALKILLQNGASVDIKTKGDSKALTYAERFQNVRCAEIIENHINKLREEREKERGIDSTIQKQQEKPAKQVSCLSFKHLFRRKKKSKHVEGV